MRIAAPTPLLGCSVEARRKAPRPRIQDPEGRVDSRDGSLASVGFHSVPVGVEGELGRGMTEPGRLTSDDRPSAFRALGPDGLRSQTGQRVPCEFSQNQGTRTQSQNTRTLVVSSACS